MCAGLAKANIAHMYRRGEGVRRDRRKALRIYRALARRGWLRGRVWVARCYAGYDGYRERPALAIRWLERTAEHDPWARARLRKYQREGRVVAPESLRRNARGTARTRKE